MPGVIPREPKARFLWQILSHLSVHSSMGNSDWLHRAPTARAGPSPGSRRLILTAQLEVAAGAVPG